MVFSSNTFLFCFLPIMLVLYYLVRDKFRGIILLLGSYLFYAWAEPKALYILIGITVLSYTVGILVEKEQNKIKKRLFLITAIIIDIGILVYFKYTNFIIETINSITNKDFALHKVILPLGISFFVFQSIGYIVDVYKEKIEPDKNFIRVALFFGLFSKVTQGPITRYDEMSEDLHRVHELPGDMYEGIRRFIIGLTKKLLIADILGQVVDSIFALSPNALSTSVAWGGAIAYTLQIYYDFSGYSDMAIGLGRMFGFRLTENFNYPYIADSITDCWRRWHISLSRWFKDYIYIPLGGNRRGNQYIHILIVFLVTGVWHGAAWTFIVWGLMHGVVRLLEKTLSDRHILSKIPFLIRWALTMLFVMIGWVLFRSPSLNNFLSYLRAMFGFGNTSSLTIGWFFNGKIILLTVVAVMAAVPWKKFFPSNWLYYKNSISVQVTERLILLVMLIICIILIMTSTYTSFIYFQF